MQIGTGKKATEELQWKTKNMWLTLIKNQQRSYRGTVRTISIKTTTTGKINTKQTVTNWPYMYLH